MSTISSTSWKDNFSDLFHRSVAKYRAGHRQAVGLVDAEGEKFLHSIGYNGQEFFDFIEDFSKDGVPELPTALAIAAVRRDYFLDEQKGAFSAHRLSMASLPAKDEELEGIGWLPRIIAKAQAKLKGEMPPELMYSCGGDRRFFQTHHVDPAEFLRQVWQTDGAAKKIAAWVKGQRPKN
jgi:hypothetical protein